MVKPKCHAHRSAPELNKMVDKSTRFMFEADSEALFDLSVKLGTLRTINEKLRDSRQIAH